MHLMRKIVNQSSKLLGDGGSSSCQDHSLSLMHLKKLFSEVNKPGTSAKEIENNIYNMLPLFCKIFSSMSAEEIMDKFPDVLQFCNHVSRLMVSEIRRRASNQSTEAASSAIVKYLEIESSEEQSSGWMLLSTINLLTSASHDAFINGMTIAALPSTLVKCFYLFFDLPDIHNPDLLIQGCEFTPRERRVLLQKIFVQVLIRLCSHTSPAEELVRKDDLMLLFNAITSPCPPHNFPWRRSASEVLMTLSRHGLTPNVVQYIHTNKCIGLCLENIQKCGEDLTVIEKVEMLVTLFCFLKDSSEVSQMILDDFRSFNGYGYISEFLLSHGHSTDTTNELTQALRNLLLLLGSLCSCGFMQLQPNLKNTSIFQMPGFTIPKCSNTGMSIRNLQAFNVLQTVFLKASSYQLCSTILDVVYSLYNHDQVNYFILEPQDTLPLFAEKIPFKHEDIQVKYFEIVEYVAFNLNYVPFKELIYFSLLIKDNKSLSCSIYCIKTLLRLLQHHSIYKDVFREVGLIEVFVLCLQRYHTYLTKNEGGEKVEKHDDDDEDNNVNKETEDKKATTNIQTNANNTVKGHAVETKKPETSGKKETESSGAKLLESSGTKGTEPSGKKKDDEEEQLMGALALEALSGLLNNDNAGVFRDAGGFKWVRALVLPKASRSKALMIARQLMATNSGEEEMASLLVLMHTSPSTKLSLKINILMSLLQVLKESHRSRVGFRRVGGFVYLMSVLVSLEGALCDSPKPPWNLESRGDVLLLIKLLFSTLCVAVRFEPANARFFASEVRYSSLTESLRLLGCFTVEDSNAANNKNYNEDKGRGVENEVSGDWVDHEFTSNVIDQSHFFFTSQLTSEQKKGLPGVLLPASMMLKHLFDMALDNFEKPVLTSQISYENVEQSQERSHQNTLKPNDSNKKNATSLSLAINEPIIIHPGAVISFLHLIPAITPSNPSHEKHAFCLQVQMCRVLKCLLRSERNQQMMCDASLLGNLFKGSNEALLHEGHPLHPPFQYIFERLSAQSLSPMELRNFFRLGLPLCSASDDECTYDPRKVLSSIPSFNKAHTDIIKSTTKIDNDTASTDPKEGLKQNTGGLIPLSRVKCLVSMTTPRDIRLTGRNVVPAFASFDMQHEGFGCLFVPSIAPQAYSSVPSSVHTGGVIGAFAPSSTSSFDQQVFSGIGIGERTFPPCVGLTFFSWFCIDKFSNPNIDAHPVRLLSIIRSINNEMMACLNIFISHLDRNLVISTKETLVSNLASTEQQQASTNPSSPSVDSFVKLDCGDNILEGQWKHLSIILHKNNSIKNSTVTVLFDDVSLGSFKLPYISSYLLSSIQPCGMSVFSYIGTPPNLRKTSTLQWKQGPCYLIEDSLPTSVAQMVYQLGPNYIGSFQAPSLDKLETSSKVRQSSSTTSSSSSSSSNFHSHAGALINEEKLIFGIHAQAMSVMTIAKIRKVFNKVDAKAVARHLNLSIHENATPIKMLHNSSGHLSGAARSIGAVLIGYLGVRTFCPRPVAKVIMSVSGTSALLSMVAMAGNIEMLYASLKALICVVKSNREAALEMDLNKGYQYLAMIFKKKQNLLNSHILHLTFSLVGTLDSGRDTTTIPNQQAFESLLADFDIWQEASTELHKSLFEHLYELLVESSDRQWNKALMLKLGMVSRLLIVVNSPSVSQTTTNIVSTLLYVLLSGPPFHSLSLLKFGQFVASLISPASTDERSIVLLANKSTNKNQKEDASGRNNDTFEAMVRHNIKLRNVLLDIINKLVTSCSHASKNNKNSSSPQVNFQFFEELHRTLGLDWLLLFLHNQVHRSTVITTMSILLKVVQNHPILMQRFKEGCGGGGWLTDVQLNSCISLLASGMEGSKPSLTSAPSNASMTSMGGREVNQDLCNVPGFVALNWLLCQHSDVTEVNFLVLMLLLNQSVVDVPSDAKFTLDSIWTHLLQRTESEAIKGGSVRFEYCLEGAVIALSFVRRAFNLSPAEQESETWAKEYPISILQFLLFLYHNHVDFRNLCTTPDFINALSSTLFPLRFASEVNHSGSSSPTDEFKSFSSVDVIRAACCFNDKNYLTTHVAKKFVTDFFRKIIFDSLACPPNSKCLPVIDIVLEVSPEFSSRQERIQYQTEVLSLLMEHLLIGDTLLEESLLTNSNPSTSQPYLTSNVFYLAGRVVDKLWQGAYSRNPNEVFEFINLLICQSKKKASSINLGGVYKSLNRTILYQLSRPLSSLAHFNAVSDTLHKLLANKVLIFGPSNNDIEFVGCLTYCLMQLCDLSPNNIRVLLELNSPQAMRTTTWHLEESASKTDLEPVFADNDASLQILKSLASSARRVWEEVFVCKKSMIEEVFKVALSTSSDHTNVKKLNTPDLVSIKPQILEPATKLWLSYYENERRCLYNQSDRLNSQLHAKLQKVGWGMMKMASRKNKKDVCNKNIFFTQPEFLTGSSLHLAMIRQLVQFRSAQHVQNQEHVMTYLEEEWKVVEGEMMRERGLWGPVLPNHLDKFILDATEGPCRMRKKLIRNPSFYHHYPYRPELEVNRELKHKIATSLDSKAFFYSYKAYSLIDRCRLKPPLTGRMPSSEESFERGASCSEEEREMLGDIKLHEKMLKNLPKKKQLESNDEDGADQDSEATSTSEGGGEATGSGANVLHKTASASEPSTPFFRSDVQSDSQSLFRMLGREETISHMFRCARIQGLDTREGLLLFAKEHLYIVDGFTLVTSRDVTDIADIDSLSFDSHDPIVPRTGKPAATKKMSFKISYNGMREVHKRRYLLQPIAIEIFSSDGRNFLLVFPKKMRNKIYSRFLAVGTCLTDSAQESVSGQRLNAKVEQSAGIISSLIGEKSVTQRWERGEISNFEYLMCLNSLAGRSYNDLMQYPVFPWVVADYDSEELDLNDPGTFRDLTAPMGAQTPDRLKQFKKRYSDWDDPHGETPPYHYGTHYSSAMIVASYLVRTEPFTQTFLKLQGGHFDLADRMFHSIKDAWLSASRHNMADVKELIPEFFYLPEFLVNSNNFDLGIKQNGIALKDVILPTWAKQDPQEFIRAHREALECDYVSSKINEWIDLIFGYKQQPPAAVAAVNVFHHLFYEGNVNIYDIDDPLKKNAIIGFINNFGQIPKQLFKKPHPSKRLSLKVGPLPPVFLSYTPNDKIFFHHLDNLMPSQQPIKELKGAVGLISCSEKNIVAVEQHKTLISPSKFLAWGYPDMSIRVGNYDNDKTTHVMESVEFGDILCAVCPTDQTLITGGTNTVVKVWSIDCKKDTVNRPGHSGTATPITFKKSLFGHTEAVTCLAVSSAYNIIISGSRDRTCIMWDLNELCFVRQLRGHTSPLAAVYINDLTGDIATCSGTFLHLWSVNGAEIASVNTATSRDLQIQCVTMSQTKEWDASNVILTGSSDGVVRMWSVEFVQVKMEMRKEKENKSNEDKKEDTTENKPEIKVENKDNLSSEKTDVHSRRGSMLKDWLDRKAEKKKKWEEEEEEGDEGNRGVVGRNEWLKNDLEDCATPPQTPFNARKPVHLRHLSNSAESSKESLDMTQPITQPSTAPVKQPSSASSTSLKDFYMFSEEEVKEAQQKSKLGSKKVLKKGFRWQRQLVFRNKLSMQMDKKEENQAPAITALAISKDHRTVYVGDVKGHIHSWVVADGGSKSLLDHFTKDEVGDYCHHCRVRFSFAERRHHCRNCGQLFCSKCSNYEVEVTRMKTTKTLKVCHSCLLSLKDEPH